MCGIVGYVGPRPSEPILVAGLARLESADTTPPASPSSTTTAASACASARASSGAARRPRRPHPLPAGTTGIGQARWATHGGSRPTAMRTRTSPTTTSWRSDPQRHHRELRRDQSRAALRGLHLPQRDRHRGRGHPARSRVPRRRRATSQAAFRAVVVRLEGAFTLLAMHEDHPGLVVGARRNSPLVIGLGEGENFLGVRRRRVRRAHPQRARHRPGPDRRDHARGRRRHRFRRQPGRSRAVRGAVGCRGRRQGRMVELHGQGDQRGARGRREHHPRPHPRGSGRDPGARRSRRAVRRHQPRHHRRLRHRRVRRAWSASTRSSSGRGCRSTSSSRTSSAIATR